MAQYREYTTKYFISDDQIVVTSYIGVNTVSDIVARDGSEDTNFATVANAHKAIALEARPTATSPPCTVTTLGRWQKSFLGDTFVTPATAIRVPTGNSGDLVLHRDAGSYNLKYIVNGGSATTFADEDVITVVDGDTLAFSVDTLAEQEIANGYVVDEDTGVTLDAISMLNTTPAP